VFGRETSPGPAAVAAGATLNFGGGTHVLSAGSSVTGAGNVQFGGAVTVLGAYNVAGTTTVITGGVATFEVNVTLPSLTLSGGTLGGTAPRTVSSPVHRTGG